MKNDSERTNSMKMRTITLQQVKVRINKNYECIQEVERLIPYQKQTAQKLELISLIGHMYSEYVTGVYSSDSLEQCISEIGNHVIHTKQGRVEKNKILIVMSRAYYIGGHTVLVHNWIKWDKAKQYSIVFTDSSFLDVPDFINDAVDESGGQIVCLKGGYLEKAQQLAQLSQNFERIILSTHMHDIIPVLAYSNPHWEIPIYFYNHADFRFSYGFQISDVILNLGQFDVDKSIRYRGVKKDKSVYMQFPGMGNFEQPQNTVNKDIAREEINKKYGIKQNAKLIVSMGADFKYESIIGYEFDKYVEKLLDMSNVESFFLIIGADKKKNKWIELEQSTNGKAKALGVLPREKAQFLISVADLYISSFPMTAEGRSIAESFGVPYLDINIIGRNINPKDIRTANSIEELIDKSIDVLNGNSEKYLNITNTEQWSRERWLQEWQKVYETFSTHSIQEFHPQRHIEKQEYVNCQLMQEKAGQVIAYYVSTHPVSSQVRQKLMELDQKYQMGIFQKDIYESYNDVIGLADKNYKLYQTAIKWLRVKQSGRQIAQYLGQKGCHTIAIYGMSYMGQTLADELADSSVKALYGIDQNAGNIKAKIKIYRPLDEIEPVDLIVNTTIIDSQIILHGMKEKGIPMVVFDDLLDEILQ